MAKLFAANGAPPVRSVKPDFSGLVQIICGQQVSSQSAAAIWRRVSEGLTPVNAATVRASSDERLAALGLSRPKIRTLKSLAEAVASEALDIRALNRASDDDVFSRLTALHGIGPWTADIYLLFALQRPDAFPAGDLALQLAAGRLFASDARVAQADLVELAERWRPWRAIAARMLWHDYGRMRDAARMSSIKKTKNARKT